MPKTIESTVHAIAQPIVMNEGCVLVDVEYKREAEGMVLTIFIDKPGGVTVDDCERVSVAIDPVLDEKDPIPESYYLSVSSPGLDRPLKTDADLRRYLGLKIVIKLYRSIDKKKEYAGELLRFDNDEIAIKTAIKEYVFVRRDIAHITPFIDF